MNKKFPDQISPPGGWISRGRIQLGPLTEAEANIHHRVVSTLAVRVGRVNAPNLFLMLMRANQFPVSAAVSAVMFLWTAVMSLPKKRFWPPDFIMDSRTLLFERQTAPYK